MFIQLCLPSPRHGWERCEKERGGVVGDKIVFVKCFQDTTQAPGAIMRDDGFSLLSHSQIFLVIFFHVFESTNKNRWEQASTLCKNIKEYLHYVVPFCFCLKGSVDLYVRCQAVSAMDVEHLSSVWDPWCPLVARLLSPVSSECPQISQHRCFIISQ